MEGAPSEGEPDAPTPEATEAEATPAEEVESVDSGSEGPAEPEAESEDIVEAEAGEESAVAEAGPMAQAAEGAAEAESEDIVEAEAGEESAVAEAGSMAQAAEGAAEAPPIPAAAEDERKWYVVHCYSGYENKVRHNLEQRIETMGMKDRIFDVVVPTEEEIEVRDGKRRTVERRVFPGYLLVQMILSEESWYVVRNTPGVTGFVGMGNDPTPLRPEEVAQIVKRMEAEAPRFKVTYKTGERVRIIDGPFNDFIGTVDEIDMERAKVRVMVSFFGRETPVELDFLQVEKA
jgi:transcriptional antiterminator NusG